MKLNENFVIHTIDDETMLIPTAEAPFHGLGEGNETVGVILRCLNLSIILDTFNSNKIKQLPISHENTVSA